MRAANGSTGDLPRALVLSVQRMSTEDGPGIRTTVFLKGCTLACDWCHNPESISGRRQAVWARERCIGCGLCAGACASGALGEAGANVVARVDGGRCRACGACAESCPSGAMELLGAERGLEELLREVERDRAFYAGAGGGGVTLSGGEPLAQAAFAAAFLAGCRERGLHAALDTCGCAPTAAFEAAARQAALLLYDVKLADPELHRRHTGRDNSVVLEHLRLAARLIGEGEGPGELWVRTPLVPGVTDGDDNIRAIGALLAREAGDAVARWELCAFNNLCRDQYARLGKTWAYAQAKPQTAAELERVVHAARSSGFDGKKVFITGSSRD